MLYPLSYEGSCPPPVRVRSRTPAADGTVVLPTRSSRAGPHRVPPPAIGPFGSPRRRVVAAVFGWCSPGNCALGLLASSSTDHGRPSRNRRRREPSACVDGDRRRPCLGPSRAARPARARGLVHQHGAGQRQGAGASTPRDRRGAGRASAVRPPATPDVGRGGRARLREPPPVAGVALRHAGRGGDRRRTGLRPHRPRGGREGADRVHLGQPHRSDPCGKRVVGRLRRRHGTGHDDRCGWHVHREYYVNDTGGQIRALGESILARRRRRGGARIGVPGRVRGRPRRRVRRARGRRGGRALGGKADPREHPGHAGRA